ncbi:MAG: hypothetical protein ACHQ1H_07770 [Nitrososphaerales archaeon]
MKNKEARTKNITKRARQAVTTEKAQQRKKRDYVPARTRAPTRTSPELAILSILARSPASGIRTYIVLHEVKTKWFPELTVTDTNAVYPESKKKIVDSVIKFAKKHLIMRGEVFPPSAENPMGIWRATSLGVERALKEAGNWVPKYTDVNSLVQTEEE